MSSKNCGSPILGIGETRELPVVDIQKSLASLKVSTLKAGNSDCFVEIETTENNAEGRRGQHRGTRSRKKAAHNNENQASTSKRKDHG